VVQKCYTFQDSFCPNWARTARDPIGMYGFNGVSQADFDGWRGWEACVPVDA
jgi:hypothetical protein